MTHARWTTARSLLLGLALLLGGSLGAAGAEGDPGTTASTPPAASAGPAASASPAASAAPAASGMPHVSSSPSDMGRDLRSVPIRTELVIAGLTTPVYVADDGTGQPCIYVVERRGTVQILSEGFLKPRPFLDLSKLVREGAELGLHAIAFHPDFEDNRRVFAHFNDQRGRTRVSEFRGRPCAPGRRADSRPVRNLLTIEQPYPNDNAGWIGFGPDGYLYVPLGDGGGVSPGDPDGIGQSRGALLSKVLRLDVDRGRRYGIPRDNPFAQRKQGYPRETWAMGLRDPRRASFDRATGDLWIGDVGQDRFEEVDRIPAGESALNFGWSHMEGDQCHNLPSCDPSSYELPVHLYDQVSPHCSIVGGYVYRGEAIRGLQGAYLFSDFCSGFIWGIDAEAVAAGDPARAQVLLDEPQGFVSFGEDDDGELYLVALGGSVYRIEGERAG